MRFAKYHGLGNDYIVLDPADAGQDLPADLVRLICHRNFGVGADGILLGPLENLPGESVAGVEPGRSQKPAGLALRIFNPDGSEAAKSGNGLRIFARYLRDRRLVGDGPFAVRTKGGLVTCRVMDAGRRVTVQMGRVSFNSRDIPVAGPPREVLEESITVLGRPLRFCAATIGNPHCVVLDADVTPATARTYGPAIETDPRFPDRTNVQLLQVLDRANIRIEIWERGAGYTLASGSSSCAAAAVACRLGLCDGDVTVHMPGGELSVRISPDFDITMAGPVVKVCEGDINSGHLPIF